MNRVYWNNFATELFLSCSADWSVRLWNQETTTPLQTFKGAQVSLILAQQRRVVLRVIDDM